MPYQGQFLSLPVSLLSLLHVATSAPTKPIAINREDYKNNPIFDVSQYTSISEWFSAQGPILEIADNATKECLSHFSVDEDNSVCYGDDKWEWNAVAIICVTVILAGIIVVLWVCCDWAQTSILWFLGDAKDEGESSSGTETSPDGREDDGCQAKLKEPERRVDPAHSEDDGDEPQAKFKDAEKRIDSVHSQTTDDDLLARPVLVGDDFSSNSYGFQESDSTLRNLGWLR